MEVGELPGGNLIKILACLSIINYNVFSANPFINIKLNQDLGENNVVSSILGRGYVGYDILLMMQGWIVAQSIHYGAKKSSIQEATIKLWINKYFQIAPIVYLYSIFTYLFFEALDFSDFITNLLFIGNCTNNQLLTTLWFTQILFQLILVSSFWIQFCDGLEFDYQMLSNAILIFAMISIQSPTGERYLIFDRGSSYFIGIAFFYVTQRYKRNPDVGSILLKTFVACSIIFTFFSLYLIPTVSGLNIFIATVVFGIFIIACFHKNQDSYRANILNQDFIQWVGKISISMVITNGIIFNDLKVAEIYDTYFKYSLSDYPRNYLWFAIEISIALLITIIISYLGEKFIIKHSQNYASSLISQVPRGLTLSFIKIVSGILLFILIIGAVIFNTLPQLKHNQFTPIKLRLSQDFLAGQLSQHNYDLLQYFQDIPIEDQKQEQYQIKGVNFYLTSRKLREGKIFTLKYDQSKRDFIIEAQDVELFGDGLIQAGVSSSEFKFHSIFKKIQFQFGMRQASKLKGPIFEATAQQFQMDLLNLTLEKDMADSDQKIIIMSKLAATLRSQILLKIEQQNIGHQILLQSQQGEQASIEQQPFNLIKHLTQMSEGVFFYEDLIQFNLRYSTIYGYHPVSNSNLQDLLFQPIGNRRPLVQLKFDAEYFNELLAYLRDHKGWLNLDEDNISIIEEQLNITFPKTIGNLSKVLPNFELDYDDNQKINWIYSFNPIKDSFLQQQSDYGIQFTAEGDLNFKYKAVLAAHFYDSNGNYREVRRFYPEISLELNFQLDPYTYKLNVNMKKLQFNSMKSFKKSVERSEDEFYISNEANLALVKLKNMINEINPKLKEMSQVPFWLKCLGINEPEIAIRFEDRYAQIDIIGSMDTKSSKLKDSSKCLRFQKDLMQNSLSAIFTIAFENQSNLKSETGYQPIDFDKAMISAINDEYSEQNDVDLD
ncbi:UNKNOWN [Stylonychia lemnae]|uniref:Transmembrane protein n=1 Tax=Stylonychia lemnae TaxID=5949 RepID=A0A078B641_STYLE|nr:UNKNOWN [Stylonychia lemnae]|eukprot:CDW89691.1 UNKNOWN [Stylonychia lemnae]